MTIKFLLNVKTIALNEANVLYIICNPNLCYRFNSVKNLGIWPFTRPPNGFRLKLVGLAGDPDTVSIQTIVCYSISIHQIRRLKFLQISLSIKMVLGILSF